MEAALAEHDPRKPFSFPREPRPMPPAEAIRVPQLGEIAALLDWAFPLIQARYPRAMKMPVRQMLTHAATGPAHPPMRVACTANAIGLAVAERDCFEPEWVVRVRFVVDRDAPVEAELVTAALRDWSQTIGAISVVDDEGAVAAPEQPAAAVKRPVKRKRAKSGTRRRSAARKSPPHSDLAASSDQVAAEAQEIEVLSSLPA